MTVAKTVLADAFPERTVRAVEPVEAGNRRRTAVARFTESRPVVVQYAPDGAFDTEAALGRLVRAETSVPVPEPMAVGRFDGGGYLVSEYRPGCDLHTAFADLSPVRQRNLAHAFGRYLAELHDIVAFEGCGELRVNRSPTAPAPEQSLTAPARACGAWLREYGERAIKRLPGEFDPLRADLCDAVRAAADSVTEQPRLYPWDLRPGNALVDGDITAVVDWERPLAAPAGLALAKTTYLVATWYVDDPDPLRAALRRGYAGVGPLPTVRPGHRVAAIADSAVDSDGAVTRPGYPEQTREQALTFHRRALAAAADLSRSG